MSRELWAGGSLVLTDLAKRVNSIKVGQNGYVFILDKDGKYVTNPTIEPGTENTEPYVTKFYESNTGAVDFQFNGVNNKGVFVTNELTGWKIIGAIEMSEITNATKGILYTTIAVIVIAIIIGVCLPCGSSAR
nr:MULTISPECIES: Cache 3/Cache 2 fusion domain-containing protein [unclassified Paenibacillus]